MSLPESPQAGPFASGLNAELTPEVLKGPQTETVQTEGGPAKGGPAPDPLPVPEPDPQAGARSVKVGGPPGTGKTTWLLRTVVRALEHGIEIDGECHRVNPDQVTIVTFTRSAATTVRQRIEAMRAGGGLDETEGRIRIGTLHALAIEELVEQGVKVTLCRQGALLKDWNERHPQWKLSPQGTDGAQEEGRATQADDMLGRIDLLRSRLVPEDEWEAQLEAAIAALPCGRRTSTPTAAQHLKLWESYTEWKALNTAMDFTDVIVQAHEHPVIGMLLMIDEAQDFSPLELQLVRNWSYGFARTIHIGDDDQSIYAGLKGADPEAFATLEAEHCIVLEQSWRVPARVQTLAERVLLGIAPERRWNKAYRPRDEPGQVALSPATWEDPEPLLPLLEAATVRAQQGEGGQVMILAHARRMLEPLMLMLKREGIPYHNPYAFNGSWTPLPILTGERAGAREKVLAFMHPGERTVLQVQRATSALGASGAFGRGQVKAFRDDLKALVQDDPEQPLPAHLEEAMSPELRAALERRDLDWMAEHLDSASKKVAAWNVAFELARLGRLEMTPAVILGTIHSVKGAEADHVVLFPDLTEARPQLDEETLRLMYVAMTRALHGLIVCDPVARGLPVRELLGG